MQALGLQRANNTVGAVRIDCMWTNQLLDIGSAVLALLKLSFMSLIFRGSSITLLDWLVSRDLSDSHLTYLLCPCNLSFGALIVQVIADWVQFREPHHLRLFVKLFLRHRKVSLLHCSYLGLVVLLFFNGRALSYILAHLGKRSFLHIVYVSDFSALSDLVRVGELWLYTISVDAAIAQFKWHRVRRVQDLLWNSFFLQATTNLLVLFLFDLLSKRV